MEARRYARGGDVMDLTITYRAEPDAIEVFDSIAPGPVSRDKVIRLEEWLKQFPQAKEKVTHHFSPGIYVRELFIPKGSILTGKIHRHAHLNIMTKGDISVLTEHGVVRLTGPCTLTSHPGIKRAGYAHEDTVWMTVHPNPDDEQDMAKLEARYIAPSFAEIELTVEPDRLEGTP